MSYARRMAEICQGTNEAVACIQLAMDAEAEIERLKASGIHTCHAHCQRLECVQRREIERLRYAIEGALRIKDLWLPVVMVNDEHAEECKALDLMLHSLESALRADERAK